MVLAVVFFPRCKLKLKPFVRSYPNRGSGRGHMDLWARRMVNVQSFRHSAEGEKNVWRWRGNETCGREANLAHEGRSEKMRGEKVSCDSLIKGIRGLKGQGRTEGKNEKYNQEKMHYNVLAMKKGGGKIKKGKKKIIIVGLQMIRI